MGEMRNAYRNSVTGDLTGREHRICGRSWEDNIKMGLKEMGRKLD
jgi:hypothetical protein